MRSTTATYCHNSHCGQPAPPAPASIDSKPSIVWYGGDVGCYRYEVYNEPCIRLEYAEDRESVRSLAPGSVTGATDSTPQTPRPDEPEADDGSDGLGPEMKGSEGWLNSTVADPQPLPLPPQQWKQSNSQLDSFSAHDGEPSFLHQQPTIPAGTTRSTVASPLSPRRQAAELRSPLSADQSGNGRRGSPPSYEATCANGVAKPVNFPGNTRHPPQAPQWSTFPKHQSQQLSADAIEFLCKIRNQQKVTNRISRTTHRGGTEDHPCNFLLKSLSIPNKIYNASSQFEVGESSVVLIRLEQGWDIGKRANKVDPTYGGRTRVFGVVHREAHPGYMAQVDKCKRLSVELKRFSIADFLPENQHAKLLVVKQWAIRVDCHWVKITLDNHRVLPLGDLKQVACHLGHVLGMHVWLHDDHGGAW